MSKCYILNVELVERDFAMNFVANGHTLGWYWFNDETWEAWVSNAHQPIGEYATAFEAHNAIVKELGLVSTENERGKA